MAASDVPPAVATTAYYVVAEAIANALKHADPTDVAVDVVREGAAVRVVVTDDGRGGAMESAGTGLAGLRDRVVATGGELIVDSRVCEGTRIEATLPCE